MGDASEGRKINETMVRFDRVLPGPITRVWDFLTRSDNLAWLGGGTIEARAGGEVSLMNGHIRGIVTQWRPPYLLAFTWNVFSPGETHSSFPESYVTFELKPEGDDVILTLTHRPMLDGFAQQSMMGWHTILDMFDAQVRGLPTPSREAVMEQNRVRYGVSNIKTTRDASN
jgi:uncharacterized protein YndB with AHSA1/START domain